MVGWLVGCLLLVGCTRPLSRRRFCNDGRVARTRLRICRLKPVVSSPPPTAKTAQNKKVRCARKFEINNPISIPQLFTNSPTRQPTDSLHSPPTHSTLRGGLALPIGSIMEQLHPLRLLGGLTAADLWPTTNLALPAWLLLVFVPRWRHTPSVALAVSLISAILYCGVVGSMLLYVRSLVTGWLLDWVPACLRKEIRGWGHARGWAAHLLTCCGQSYLLAPVLVCLASCCVSLRVAILKTRKCRVHARLAFTACPHLRDA